MFSALRNPCCSPAKGTYATGTPRCLERVENQLRLIGRHDLVFQALQQDHRAVEVFEVEDRRALAIAGFFLRIRADEPVEVPRLEFVRVVDHEGEVADAVRAGAAAEDVAERQAGERRVAAGAAAADHEFVAIGLALVGKIPGGVGGVGHVDDAPGIAEAIAVLAAVAGAAAVVHVAHGEAARGPELRRQPELGSRGRGGAAVNEHQEWRCFARWAAEIAVRGRIVKGVGRLAVGGGELDRFGDGSVASGRSRSRCRRRAAANHLRLAGWQIDFDQRFRLGRRAGDAKRPIAGDVDA